MTWHKYFVFGLDEDSAASQSFGKECTQAFKFWEYLHRQAARAAGGIQSNPVTARGPVRGVDFVLVTAPVFFWSRAHPGQMTHSSDNGVVLLWACPTMPACSSLTADPGMPAEGGTGHKKQPHSTTVALQGLLCTLGP